MEQYLIEVTGGGYPGLKGQEFFGRIGGRLKEFNASPVHAFWIKFRVTTM
jgi:hypothetical protein